MAATIMVDHITFRRNRESLSSGTHHRSPRKSHVEEMESRNEPIKISTSRVSLDRGGIARKGLSFFIRARGLPDEASREER